MIPSFQTIPMAKIREGCRKWGGPQVTMGVNTGGLLTGMIWVYPRFGTPSNFDHSTLLVGTISTMVRCFTKIGTEKICLHDTITISSDSTY